MPRLLLALCLLTACKKRGFCDQDLSGLWLNSSDPHFAYRFRDHGGVLRGEYLEREDDGGLQNPAEPILFELHRTSDAMAGVMKATGRTSGGRDCPVEYGIQLTSCQSDVLFARVETAVQVGEDCKRLFLEDGGEAAPRLAEFRFERSPHPSGGGDRPLAH
jgi:hypothetical protein